MFRTPLIMVVDGNDDNIQAARNAFDAADHVFEMKSASSLAEARTQLDAHAPDLIVTAFRLSDGKCTEMVRAVFACPIIVMSDNNDAAEATEAMKAGAADFIVRTTESMLALPATAAKVLLARDRDEDEQAHGPFTGGSWRTVGALTRGLADRLCDALRPLTRECEAARDDISRESESYWHLTSAIKAARQSQDLAEYLRTATEPDTQAPRSLPAENVIRDAIRVVRAAAPPSIAIRCEISDIDTNIETDPARVRQLIYRTCLDAFNAMPAGGLIEISLEKTPPAGAFSADRGNRRFVRLTVRDSVAARVPAQNEAVASARHYYLPVS